MVWSSTYLSATACRGACGGLRQPLFTRQTVRPLPVLSLDVPSGVDTATGEVYEPAIEANATLTLALPKVGLRAAEGRPHVGDLYLGGHRRSD
jgi:NAD(P)H-hydrate repair Nnr-like enzyme with NAD(P)H-hydrate epimerase domain